MNCKCGCGGQARPGNSYIDHHNLRGLPRTPTWRGNISRSNTEEGARIKCAKCGKMFRVAAYRKDTAQYCSSSCRSQATYPKALARGFHAKGRIPANKGKRTPEETRKKLSLSHLGQRAWNAGTKDKLKARLNQTLRSAVSRTLSRGAKKMRHWEHLVGWTVAEFKAHIQSLFEDGMSWENYGDWEIDHVIPISAFNFDKPEDFDFRRCWSLNNLQPLWKNKNRSKKATLQAAFQPGLRIAYYGHLKERGGA